MKRLMMITRRMLRMLTLRRRPPPGRYARTPDSFC